MTKIRNVIYFFSNDNYLQARGQQNLFTITIFQSQQQKIVMNTYE